MNLIKNCDFLYKPYSIDSSEYQVIKVAGIDAEGFLHNQTTNDVKSLELKTFHINALTDNKGRLCSWFYVLKESDSEFLIVVQESLYRPTMERLEQYHISEEVEFTKNEEKIFFTINCNGEFEGTLFGQKAAISFEKINMPALSIENVEKLKIISGQTNIEPGQLLTNFVIVDECLSMSKGCYPGQETISKIVNNRGAGYFPVCVIGERQIIEGDLKVSDKKVGTVSSSVLIENQYYHFASLNREYRIENLKFNYEDSNYLVKNYPLLPIDDNERSRVLYDYAIELFHSDKINAALEILKYCIVLDPAFEDAYEIVGVIYGREDKYDLAIEWMHKLAESFPKSVMAHTNLSLFYMKSGEIEKAEDHKGIATFKTFEKLGDDAEAKRQAEEVKEANQVERLERMQMYRDVLEIDPDDPLANYGLGDYLLEDKKWDEAITHLSKAIEADPNYSVAYLSLGQSHLGNEDTSKALEIFNIGINIASKKGDLMPANKMQSIKIKLTQK